MTRDELISRLYADSPLFYTREKFERTLDGWEIHEVEGPRGLAGVVVTNGPEFHFAKWDPLYQVTREDLRRWPGELIAKHGFATTKTPKEDTRQQRFNERLGFVRTGEDQYDIHYRIDSLRVKD